MVLSRYDVDTQTGCRLIHPANSAGILALAAPRYKSPPTNA